GDVERRPQDVVRAARKRGRADVRRGRACDRHAGEAADANVILSSARFSRDGQWVAFHALRNANNSAQIWIVPAGLERPVRPVPQTAWVAVTGGDALERDPAWSPDGQFIYFLSERDGFRCVWTRRLDPPAARPATEARRVARSARADDQPSEG